MSGLMFPNTPSGRMAAKHKSVADALTANSRYELSSDEFLSRKDILRQLEKLQAYVEAMKDREPTYLLPSPVGWRLSILVLEPPTTTSGGLEIPDNITEQYAHKSMQGIILAMGDTAYTDKERFPSGAWCRPGDRIVFKRYDSAPFELANGQKIGFLNDTQPIGVVGRGYVTEEKSNG